MDQDQGDTQPGLLHPEEIRLEAEISVAGKRIARAAIRTTPAALICEGLGVAAILLASAVVVRAVR